MAFHPCWGLDLRCKAGVKSQKKLCRAQTNGMAFHPCWGLDLRCKAGVKSHQKSQYPSIPVSQQKTENSHDMYRQALTLRPLGLLWPASASDPGQQDRSFVSRPWAAPSCIVPLGRALAAKTLLRKVAPVPPKQPNQRTARRRGQSGSGGRAREAQGRQGCTLRW